MAKQRLVDFRGGINRKISPHMIGDSQGQEAQDVDSSSVRLEGRLLIDTSEKAEGSYFYESGNLSSNTFEGRWVSIYPEDDSTYLTGATDFALWNKDLYVAFGEDSANGELQVYRDGSSTATQVNFDEPGTSSYTTYDADSTSEFLAPYSANDNSEVLIASVTGQSYVPPQTGIYPVTQQAGTGEALISIFNPVYSPTSPLYNSTHNRNTYTKNNTTYYENPSTYRLQQNTGGSAAYTVNLSTSTVGDFDPVFSPSSLFYDTRSFSGVDTQTFNTYIRNSTTYYVPTSNNTNLGVSTNEFYTQGGGTQSATISLSLSTYSDSGFNPAYTNLNATFNDRTLRPYTGIEDYTFSHTFSRSGVTYYYASTANSTLSVEAGKFYTQGGGTQSGTVNLSITTYSDSGFNPAYVNTNSTFNDFLQSGRNVSPIVNYSFDLFTHTVNGVTTTYYYAPSNNTTLGVSAGSFYTQGGSGTQTSTNSENITYEWDRTLLNTYNYAFSNRWNSTWGNYQWSWEINWVSNDKRLEVFYIDVGSYISSTGKWTSSSTSFFLNISGQNITVSGSTITVAGIPNFHVLTNSGSFCEVTLTNGDAFTLQSDRSFRRNGSTVTNGSDRLGILTSESLANGGNGNPHDIQIIRIKHASGDGRTSIGQYRVNFNSYDLSGTSLWQYEFFQMDETNGTGVFKDSSQNTLLTINNVEDTYTTATTSGGWTYNIPATSVSPSSSSPSGVSRTAGGIQSFSIATTRTGSVSTPVNYTYSLHTDSYTGLVPVNYTYSVHTDSYVGTVPSNYTYSQFTPYSQSFPATFTYQDITDTVPGQTGVPDTPAFTYDDARTKLYLLYSSSSDVGNETTDNAQGYNWLQQGRNFSLSDDGYYLRTLREDVSGGTGLPVVSGDRTLATLASGSSHVFGLSLDSTPQRLNFSIVQPTDVTNPAFKGYKLERIDNESSVDLGYIAPDSNVSFTYDSSTKAVTITGLGTTSSDNYRLKFAAYQDTSVRTTLNSGTAVTAKSNMSGVLFNGNDTFTIQLIDGTNTRFRAADFWLEKKVIEGTAASTDDIYAVIRCFDLFDRNSNAVQSGVITGVCDFLDAFPNGLSSGGLSSGTTQSGVPTYLKFLKEANNFFFAVGTESTPDNRYGSANNKADSFLFVSEYNNPRSWPLTGYVEFDASITGLASYPGELIAWTPSGTFRVTGSRYDQMRKSRLATTEGMPIGHHRSIAQVGRYLVWVSQSGICFYDGDKVTNLTRGRFPTWTMQGNGLHAGQYDDTYYVVDSTETGYAVDFALEGFPVTEIDLTEDLPTPTNEVTASTYFGDTLPPVLVYKPSENKLYSRRGVIEGSQNRGSWSYKTRAFDGGSFGSLKLVRNVTLNGTGSGQVQVYLDGKPAFVDSNGASSPQTVQITSTIRTEPARIYLPASSADTQYGLNMADVWSVEIISWSGKIDWIDTEYEIISGA